MSIHRLLICETMCLLHWYDLSVPLVQWLLLMLLIVEKSNFNNDCTLHNIMIL